MINPSMQGLVKIGKTTRDPKDRLKELSAATGVPTPFTLVYSAYFRNCHSAEEYVHTRLEQTTDRLSNNREFFVASIQDAIDVILEANALMESADTFEDDSECYSAEEHCLNDDETPEIEEENSAKHDIASSIYEQAEEHYYGFDDRIVDYGEALALYKQAANLGHCFANRMIGKMYKNGEGCRQNSEMALKYFKKGASEDPRCYAEMAVIFSDEYDKHKDSINFDNCYKCWRLYFDSFLFEDEFLGSLAGTFAFSVVDYTINYMLIQKYRNQTCQHQDKILKIHVLTHNQLVDGIEYINKHDSDLSTKERMISNYKYLIREIDRWAGIKPPNNTEAQEQQEKKGGFWQKVKKALTTEI